jgi:hypothetical protein
MQKSIIDLLQVKDLPSTTFKPPIRYSHLGVEFSIKPKWISFQKIRRSDTEHNNSGRKSKHTGDELNKLITSFANGVQLWQELPIVSEVTDPEIKKHKPYNLEVGFGRSNAIGSNGETGYWHWIVTGNPTQIGDMAAFENTCDLIETKFQTGEEGIVNHLKQLLISNALGNDEEEIEKKLNQVWPGLNKPSKNRILSNVKTAATKPRRYQTYNAEDVKMWLSDSAAVQFITGSNWDANRSKLGSCAINMLDPWINACMSYAKTGKQSYVVLSVKAPGKNSTLTKKRQAHLDKLENFRSSFRKLGMNTFPLEVLGFMPQDTINEDMRFLVDTNGNKITV